MLLGKNYWKGIIKYRKEIMGFAAIIITVMHLYVSFYEDAQIPILTPVLKRGNVGVDIFLILSGCGLFFSLEKSYSIGEFYKKRMVRVLIPYLVLSILYWVLLDIIIEHDLFQFVKDVTLISFWTEGVTHYWFVAFILPVYLLYPFIYKLQKKRSINTVLLCIASIAIIVLLSITARDYYEKIEIAITRIPAFLIGSYLGEKLKKNQNGETSFLVVNVYFIVSFVLFAMSVVLNRRSPFTAEMLYRFGSGGIALILILIITGVLEKTGKSFIYRILGYFGTITLELYIISQSIRNSILLLGLGTSLGFILKLIIETVVFVISVLLSRLYVNKEKIKWNKNRYAER